MRCGPPTQLVDGSPTEEKTAHSHFSLRGASHGQPKSEPTKGHRRSGLLFVGDAKGKDAHVLQAEAQVDGFATEAAEVGVATPGNDFIDGVTLYGIDLRLASNDPATCGVRVAVF